MDDAEMARRSSGGPSERRPLTPAGPPPASAIALLADPTNHAIVSALGEARERALSAHAVGELALTAATARLIRDRIRGLTRVGVLVQVDPGSHNLTTPATWALTPAGRDLHRLGVLMARVATHAAELNSPRPLRPQDPVLSRTLSALGDPAVVAILRCLALALEPISPTELEDRCPRTPRRTLYRRLSPLVEQGVVARTTTGGVPRATSYALTDHWRPAAAIPMLAAWWEIRHAPSDVPARRLDLEPMLAAVLPRVELGGTGGTQTLRCQVAEPSGRTTTLTLEAREGRLTRQAAASAASPDLEVRGPSAGWTEALVTDHVEGLTFAGDVRQARTLINAVRSALLAYVR